MAAGGHTRRRAKHIVCQANLRQWALVFNLFANDNGDSLPQGDAGNGISAEDAWMLGATLPYYENLNLRMCPSAPPLNNTPCGSTQAIVPLSAN